MGAVLIALATVAAAFIAGAFAGPKIGINVTNNNEPAVTVAGHGQGNGNTGTGTGGQPAGGSLAAQKLGLNLTQCFGLSFTGTSMSPQPVPNCNTPADLWINAIGWVESSGELAVYSGGRASLAACRADTQYIAAGNPANPSGALLSGETLCVTTPTRIAVCYVRQDTLHDTVAAPGLLMDVTVYRR